MPDDPLSGRKRAQEEDYFQKKDRELIEKARQRAKIQEQLRQLGEQVGITDPEVSRELADLGFTPETVKLLPLMPVLEVAWAEGGVTDAERKMVVDLARAREIEAGWLTHPRKPVVVPGRGTGRGDQACVGAVARARSDSSDARTPLVMIVYIVGSMMASASSKAVSASSVRP